MKNNKGFTVIELGVSICLVTIVSFLLFQIITTVKKVYNSDDIKTTLLTKQAIMTKKIYDEFETKSVSLISNCDILQNSCLKFTFSDGSTSTLAVDVFNHVISYNNYSIDYEEIDDSITFGDLVLNKNNTFFTIKIPITLNSINGDYGIFVTHQPINTVSNAYSGASSSIIIPLYDAEGNETSTTITMSNGDYWMRVYDANNSVLNDVLSAKLKYLKIDTCSNTSLVGNSYELKTGKSTYRWCQNNNFYTQRAGEYMHVSGPINTALSKDTYIEALTSSSTLADTTLDLKVNTFIDKYTFKSR